MADTIRDTFFENKAAGALWDVAVSIKRGNPLPLDSNSVFANYSDLETYAAGVLAYPGQIVAVVNADSTGIYYLDQELGINEVGKIPSGDDKSIEVNNEKISIHDFGKVFYKYIAEVKDDEGNTTSEARYDKVEVSEENPWKAGLEPRVVSENGQLVLGWFEPNPTTIEGVNDQVTAVQGTVADIQEAIGIPGDETTEATGIYKEIDTVEDEVETVKGEVAGIQEALNGTEEVDGLIDRVGAVEEALGNKAEASNVYTKDEADNLLNAKANSADVYTKAETKGLIDSAGHLKREIVETLPAASDAKEDIIYMVKKSSVLGADKYEEYMLIDGALELIGDTSVDLSDYAKSADVTTEIAEAVDGLAKASDVTAEIAAAVKDFATDDEVSAAIIAGLTGYAKTSEVTSAITEATASLATQEALTQGLASKADKTELDSLATKQELADGIADKVTTSELAGQLANYTTSQQLTDGLALKVDQSVYDAHLTTVNNALASKLDVETWNNTLPTLATETYVNNKIGVAPTRTETEDGEVSWTGATGIYADIYTKNEIADLITDITGGESAAAVLAALNTYKSTTDPRIKALEDSVNGIPADEVNGIPAAMGLLGRVSELETLAKIKSVSNEFTLIDGALGVNTIAASKVTGLTDTIGVATSEKLGLVKSASGDNKVSVDENGIMSVNAVNVDSLTQTIGQELILNGGGAKF